MADELSQWIEHRPHNYLLKVQWVVSNIPLARGKVSDLDIKHDDWCDIFKAGYCNCEPDIRLNGTLLPVPTVGELLRKSE